MTPLEGSSLSGSSYPVSTVFRAFWPVLPCAATLNPLAFSALDLDLVIPVLRWNSARLTLSGSSSPPASWAISSKALSIISCRSLRSLILLSIVLLALV